MNKDIKEMIEELLELRKTINTMNLILINYDEGNYTEEGAINDLKETLSEVKCKNKL